MGSKKKGRSRRQNRPKKADWAYRRMKIAESARKPLREPETKPEMWLRNTHEHYYRLLSSSQIAYAWRISGNYDETFVDACRAIAYGYNPKRFVIISTPMGGQPPPKKRPARDEY